MTLCKQSHLQGNLQQEEKINMLMLLAGLRSARIEKICDLGLANAASRPRSQFFSLYGPPIRSITHIDSHDM